MASTVVNQPPSPASPQKEIQIKKEDTTRISRIEVSLGAFGQNPMRSFYSQILSTNVEKIKVPHNELDKNVDNVDSLIGEAAERNCMALACINNIAY